MEETSVLSQTGILITIALISVPVIIAAIIAVMRGRGALRDHHEQKEFKKRSEEHTSELQSRPYLVCRLLLEKKKKKISQSRCIHYAHRQSLHANARVPAD